MNCQAKLYGNCGKSGLMQCYGVLNTKMTYHSLNIIFSLLQGTIAPHFGHLTVLPSSVEVSKDFLSPKAMGEGNTAEQFLHMTSVCAI